MSLENKTILKGFLPFLKINEADDILSSSSMIVYVNMERKSNFATRYPTPCLMMLLNSYD